VNHVAEKNYQDAIDWFTKAIDLHPTAVVYSNRAFAHIKLEEYGSAIIDSTDAISLDPAYVKVCSHSSLTPTHTCTSPQILFAHFSGINFQLNSFQALAGVTVS
jgi:tetratricopeptide (TPR) repeat protein